MRILSSRCGRGLRERAWNSALSAAASAVRASSTGAPKRPAVSSTECAAVQNIAPGELAVGILCHVAVFFHAVAATEPLGGRALHHVANPGGGPHIERAFAFFRVRRIEALSASSAE